MAIRSRVRRGRAPTEPGTRSSRSTRGGREPRRREGSRQHLADLPGAPRSGHPSRKIRPDSRRSDARVQHEADHHERGDGVEAVPPGQQDQPPGHRRSRERGQVGGDEGTRRGCSGSPGGARRTGSTRSAVDPIPTSAMTVTMPACTSGGSISRRTASYRIQSAMSTSVIPVICAARIGARVAEGEPPARGERSRPGCNERQGESGGIREHVTRIGEQRERAGEDAEDDLGDHEDEDERQGDREQSPVAHSMIVVASLSFCCRPSRTSATRGPGRRTSCSAAAAPGRGVRTRKLEGRLEPGRDRVDARADHENAARGRDELGWPPTRVATTGRSDAIPSSSAWPNGSTRLGWQRTSHAGIQSATCSCATRPRSAPARDLQGAERSGPSPTKRQDLRRRRPKPRPAARRSCARRARPDRGTAAAVAVPTDAPAAASPSAPGSARGRRRSRSHRCGPSSAGSRASSSRRGNRTQR